MYVQSSRKMLFIFAVNSYSFLPFLLNLRHRLIELNVSLFYPIFYQKYLRKTITQVNVQAVKLNYIQHVCLQNVLIKQDNF